MTEITLNHNIIGHSEGKTGLDHSFKYSVHDYDKEVLTILSGIFMVMFIACMVSCGLKMKMK